MHLQICTKDAEIGIEIRAECWETLGVVNEVAVDSVGIARVTLILINYCSTKQREVSVPSKDLKKPDVHH